jgi:hypothetical protein
VSSPVYVVDIRRTCDACPAQWEGKLSTGECIYVRYRWGVLRVGIGDDPGEAIANTWFRAELGDGLDGTLDPRELVRATCGRIVWEAMPG